MIIRFYCLVQSPHRVVHRRRVVLSSRIEYVVSQQMKARRVIHEWERWWMSYKHSECK